MSSLMVCDKCSFIRQCRIGGEHMAVDVDDCPLYNSLEDTFRAHEELIDQRLNFED